MGSVGRVAQVCYLQRGSAEGGVAAARQGCRVLARARVLRAIAPMGRSGRTEAAASSGGRVVRSGRYGAGRDWRIAVLCRQAGRGERSLAFGLVVARHDAPVQAAHRGAEALRAASSAGVAWSRSGLGWVVMVKRSSRKGAGETNRPTRYRGIVYGSCSPVCFSLPKALGHGSGVFRARLPDLAAARGWPVAASLAFGQEAGCAPANPRR